MTRSRLLINLAAVAAVSAVLLIYAFTQLLVGALFDTTYPLSVTMPNSGSLLPGQEATMSGRVIGRVDDVGLEGEHAVVHLRIREGEQIPTDADVVVLRRSPIGEQAIDFRPRGTEGPYFAPGDRMAALDATIPTNVQRLLEQADRVFEPIDAERAASLLADLADAVRGRRDDLRGVITDSATLSEAVAENGRDVERFFRHSATVNAALARSRHDLARSIGEMADAAEVLSAMRGDFEGLLVEGPPVLETLERTLAASQANLSCTITSLAEINDYLAEDEQLTNIEGALRLNRWFFTGFELGGPRDFQGRVWNRIRFMEPQEQVPDSYLPEKRPIPDILPGGACVSPFGPGAPEARQPGFERITVENEIVPPSQTAASATASGGLGVPVSSTTTQGANALGLLAGMAAVAALAQRVWRTLAHRRVATRRSS